MKVTSVMAITALALGAVPALFGRAGANALDGAYLPAVAGHAYWPSEADCVLPSGSPPGAVRNYCGQDVSWVIAVPNNVGSPSGRSATFVASSSGTGDANTPICSGYVVAEGGGLAWRSEPIAVTTGTYLTDASGARPTGVRDTDTFHIVCTLKAYPGGQKLLSASAR